MVVFWYLSRKQKKKHKCRENNKKVYRPLMWWDFSYKKKKKLSDCGQVRFPSVFMLVQRGSIFKNENRYNYE